MMAPLLKMFTQFSSEGFLHDFPFRLVGWIVLLDRLHHQVHDVEQNSEIGAVSKGDGRLSYRTAAGSAVTEQQETDCRHSAEHLSTQSLV